MSADNLARLNEALTYIAENDEHADIASGEAEIDESLVDAVPEGGKGDAETETQSSEAATNSVLSNFLEYVKEQLQLEIDIHKRPLCYLRGDFYWRPPHPVFSLQREFGSNPDMVYWRDVFVWLPHLLPGFNDKRIARCIRSMPADFFLLTNRFVCDEQRDNNPGCGKNYQGSDPDMIAQLPRFVQVAFPAYISARGAISKLMMSQMANTFAACFGPAPFAALVSEIQYRSHADRELMYLAAAEFYGQSEVPPFSAFNDRNGYAGSPPSTPYLKALFTDYVSAHRIYAERDTASRTCTIGMGDHTFQVSAPIVLCTTNFLQSSFKKLLKAHKFSMRAFTVLNEFEEVRAHSLTQTKSLDFVKDMFEGIRDGLKNANHPPTQIFYTDSPQLERPFHETMNPSLTRDVEPITDWTDLPRFDRSSEIPVTSLSDSMAIDDAAHDLLRDLITPDSRLAVVALTVKDLTSRSDVLPSLRAIPHNPQIIKIGHSVRASLQTIADQFLLPEISKLAKAKNPPILDLGMYAKLKGAACKPVAEGSLAEHPGYLYAVMDDNGTTKKINVTPSRSVVLISKVLVPGAIHRLHGQTMEWIFTHGAEAVVSTSQLLTRGKRPPISSGIISRAFGAPAPPNLSENSFTLSIERKKTAEEFDNDSDDESDDNNTFEFDEDSYPDEDFDEVPDIDEEYLFNTFKPVDEVLGL
ncbi:hypothetical protein B0H14DRAFT_3137162 [Mycena olivaceomarginata]|nr:hypothetical protein B0H14DRAFT_3137162 [Mycena olivaceomarginata]